ncbi:MAG: L,D-transpeptidase [Methyloligellaceae bacterium]
MSTAFNGFGKTVARCLPLAGVLFASAALTPANAFVAEEREPTLVANIDLATQRMRVVVNGVEEHVWKISSGTRSYNTPSGTWKPYRMHRMWRSRKYQMAPMPYSVFFNKGYAVHGTQFVSRLGRPASHGCIRLRTTNAKKFYELVREHGRVLTQVNVSGAYAWKTPPRAKRKRVVRKRTYRRRYANRGWFSRSFWHSF